MGNKKPTTKKPTANTKVPIPGAKPGDKTPDGQDAANAHATGATPTQITEREHGPNTPDETPGDPKLTRFDIPPGQQAQPIEKTTITEEVKILDPETLSDDMSAQIAKMQTLAHTQGLNQSIVLGSKTVDGEQFNEVLTVLQNGDHSTELVPVQVERKRKRAKPAKK